jgi:hypothetical protein
MNGAGIVKQKRARRVNVCRKAGVQLSMRPRVEEARKGHFCGRYLRRDAGLSPGAIAWARFLARFWLGDFAAGGQLGPTPAKSDAGLGRSGVLCQSCSIIGRDRSCRANRGGYRSRGFDLAGSMGKWIRVRAANAGL